MEPYMQDEICQLAALLDCRYGIQTFTERMQPSIVQKLKSQLEILAKKIAAHHPEGIPAPPLLTGTSVEVKSFSLRFSDTSRVFHPLAGSISIETNTSTVQSEINSLLAKQINRRYPMTFSPIQAFSEDIPLISKLAKQILSIPASEAPCERVFSISGLLSSGKRAKSNPDTVCKETFCKANAFNKSL